MERIGAFDQEGGALVWRRRVSGCMAAFGWGTLLFNGLFAAGGVLAVVNRGDPLGVVFALCGGGGVLFGLALATAASEVRIDRAEAVIRRRVVVPLAERRVMVQGCSAVAAVRGMVPVPRAPRSMGPTRYAVTVSVGLVTREGFVALATEHEDGASEGSVRAAIGALQALTGLPAQDLRASADSLRAAIMERRIRWAGVALLAGVVMVPVAIALVAAAMNVGGASGGGSSSGEVERHRGRRR